MTDNDFPCCAPEKGHTMTETTNDQNPAELSPLDGPPGVGDLLRSDPARVARYAEALTMDWHDATCIEGRDCGYRSLHSKSNSWPAVMAKAVEQGTVVAVADEERAALVAEVERLKRGGKTLGEIIDKQCQMVLDATGLHDWVDEDGDGDWGAIWDHLFVLRDRARAAEAKLAKVEAERGLLWSGVFSALSRAEQIEPQGSPEWVESGNAMRTTVIREVRLALGKMPMSDEGVARIVDDLRAVLADAPAEQRAEACADCGHLHTPDGCTGPPTPSDVWAGVSPAGCDCDAAEGDGRG